MSEIKVGFDKLPDSKEVRNLNTAGVQLKYNVEEVELIPEKEKDGKTISASLRLLLKGEDHQFTVYQWAPNSDPDAVKYLSGHYVNGVEVRKKTPEEQITADFHTLYYLYEQLGKALGGDPETINRFKKGIDGVTADKLFDKMFNSFFAIFPPEKIKDKKINFKTLWNNNIKNKTSFLQLAKPSGNNFVFCQYISDDKPVLGINGAYEEKCARRMFSPLDRAPVTDDTEIDSSGIPSSTINDTDKELF